MSYLQRDIEDMDLAIEKLSDVAAELGSYLQDDKVSIMQAVVTEWLEYTKPHLEKIADSESFNTQRR
jgi:hypothetical protein